MTKTGFASGFLFIFLAGCAAVVGQSPPPFENPPPYKQIILAALRANAKPDVANATGLLSSITQIKNEYAYYEISQPRQVNIVGGWTWQVCLKGNNKGSEIYLAVFIKDDSIVEAHTSVAIDRCAQQMYESLS